MAQSNLKQPTFFANYSLPPLSPFPSNDSSNSNLKDVSMDEMDVTSRGPTMPHPFPPRRTHRRSNSDIPFVFSPQSVPISLQEASRNDKPAELKLRETGKGNYVKSEGEVVDDLVNSLLNLDHEGGLKRSVDGDITPPGRHHRSLSVDSGMMGNFSLGDDNYLCEKQGKLDSEFGHGEFSDFELKKIMTDEKLAEIAVSDPKRAKRLTIMSRIVGGRENLNTSTNGILANRQSAARSKERKMRYISELEHKVQTLQTEATTLSAQVTILQNDYAELTGQNNELKFRVQAMEQQAHIRDALHDTLAAEVQHLKLSEERRTYNQHHVFSMQHQNQQQQQPNQMQRMSVSSTSANSTTP
ncbi:hypothetical protein CASFOL_017002 [Castilleja foliolosa]|uniref:BZIP domain-containing protein n=1 Tax=Castilleja foliolosa TaxID=1961234 RepID=A0ABD3D9U2_9LAMI